MSRIAAPPPPRPIGAGGLPALAPRKPPPPVPRIVFYAPEKWGKTTFAAYAPDPLILMARGETGYDTLLTAGTVPAVPALVVDSYEQLMGYLDDLAANPQGRKTLVLDAIGGFERLCHEHVCATMFDGKWGDDGFMSYHKGYDRSVGSWLNLLQKLDTLHDRHGIVIVILGHSKIKSFNDPMGPAYDRYLCDVHEKTWQPTARWSDCILFGKFHSIVEVSSGGKKSLADKKGKGIGGTQRVIYTTGCDAFVAGNRYGMASPLGVPTNPAEMWGAVWAEIIRQKGQTQ